MRNEISVKERFQIQFCGFFPHREGVSPTIATFASHFNPKVSPTRATNVVFALNKVKSIQKRAKTRLKRAKNSVFGPKRTCNLGQENLRK